jgi:hypothetical protein
VLQVNLTLPVNQNGSHELPFPCAAARTHGRAGQGAEQRTDLFAEASTAAWREDAAPQAAAAAAQQQQPGSNAAHAAPAPRLQGPAAQPALLPGPMHRNPGQGRPGQALQASQSAQQHQQQQLQGSHARLGPTADRLQGQPPMAQQQRQQPNAPAGAAAEAAEAGAGAHAQAQAAGPSSNGATAAGHAPGAWSWDSDDDFQDAPESPGRQQDEFEDAQPEPGALSPPECAPCLICCSSSAYLRGLLQCGTWSMQQLRLLGVRTQATGGA